MSPLQSPLLAAFDHGFGTRQDGYWTPDNETARLKQIHSDVITAVDTPGHHGEGDALLTRSPGLWIEVRTADCVPILLADPVTRSVAAVHAGWRGTAARILSKTVAAMAATYGAKPEHLLAVIGPAIRQCSYQVGSEVADQFPGYMSGDHLDLHAANRQQLRDAGVQQIETIARCTFCEPDVFYSFRRDHGDGRMIAAIRIQE